MCLLIYNTCNACINLLVIHNARCKMMLLTMNVLMETPGSDCLLTWPRNRIGIDVNQFNGDLDMDIRVLIGQIIEPAYTHWKKSVIPQRNLPFKFNGPKQIPNNLQMEDFVDRRKCSIVPTCMT